MSKDQTATDRRSFLKAGAVVAAPVVAVMPAAAAFAEDGSKAKLARIEDERAIEALTRNVLRRLNGQGDCGEFLLRADAVNLCEGLRSIAGDPARDAEIAIADDGASATARQFCQVEIDTAFAGDSTLEQMARFQGQGSHRHSEDRVLKTEYVKGKNGWQVASMRLA